MADHVDGDEAQPQPRHYPLDIPHLPFNRYDHRRLTARDLIVHRLMADFMKPSRVPAAVYDMTARCDFQIHDFSWYKSRQARHRFYGHDQELFKDVRTLNDLLITSSTKRTPTVCDAVDAGPGFPGPLKQDFDTVGEHVLDLVMRHYLETDDTALRVWLSRARPPRTAEGPLGAQFNPDPRPWTRMHRNVTFDLIIESQRNRDEKSGTPLPYLDHLLTFRPRVALQDKLPLYDGGAFIPALRQIMSRHAYGIHGARRRLDFSHWTVNDNPNASLVLPAWPERNPFSRILMHPRRWYRLFSPNHTLLQPPAPLDLSLQFGRGRNRDGIWATGWDEKRLRCKTGLSGLREGRYARLRRRCASEPPLGSFATAELPVSARWPSCICLQIMYPRMSILQLDKRARRRSLSRTHIEAMFDWNLEGLADASGVPSKPPPSAQADSKAKQRGRLLCENCRSASHHTSLCPSPCGYCGAPNPRAHESRDDTASFLSSPHGSLMPQVHHNPHLAPQCPVARHNRCKCVAFPTFHTAEQCTITCRRACGNPAPPGSFAHRNAMTCRARCCMCGLRNHSGRECRLQTCRCGGAHLGQDCRWNPTCRVPGCDRFLCGLHCRECGSAEKPFVGWRCWRCLGFERPPEPDGMARKGTRKGRVGEVGDGGGEAVAEGDVAEAADGNPVVPATVAPAILTAPSVPQLPPKAPESEREEPPNASQSIFGDPRTKDSSRSNR